MDLSGATANYGDSWALVTAANATYGRRFEIIGFEYQDGIWSDGVYAFDEATGMLTVLPPPTEWNVDRGGLWSVSGNWTDGVPADADEAILGSILTAPAMIDLDVSVLLSRLTFDNTNPYTLGGNGPMTLTGDAEIIAHSGSHEVAVSVEGTAGLTVNGDGSVALSAANTYSGDTNINSGTLALADFGSIPNTPNIQVSESGTFDLTTVDGGSYTLSSQLLTIDGSVTGNLVADDESTILLNSPTAVTGNLTVRDGAMVAGLGTITGNLNAQGGTVRVGEQGLSFEPIGHLIDDFETYSLGDVRDVASPPWTPHNDSDKVDIVNDGSGTQVLAFGSNTYVGVSRYIPGAAQIGNSETATFFFRFNSRTTTPDHCFGLADEVDTQDTAYGNYEVQIRLIDDPNASRTYMLDARDGSTYSTTLASGLRPGAWYNLWVVVDQPSDTYDVYLSTDTADAVPADKLNASPLSFRNGTTASLDTILGLGIAPTDNSVWFDDIVNLDGTDLRNPTSNLSEIDNAILTVDGAVTMDNDATLEVDIVSSTVIDKLNIVGELSAAGTLDIAIGNNAETPQPGDSV